MRNQHRGVLFSHCGLTMDKGIPKKAKAAQFFSIKILLEYLQVWRFFWEKMKSFAVCPIRCTFAMRKENTKERNHDERCAIREDSA